MADQLYLRDDFEQAWNGRDPFQCADELKGDIYREIANRKTLRFILNGKSFFIKIHRGIGFIEMLKSFLHGNIPIWGAEQEWLAIQWLKALGVKTMMPVAFAVKGFLPWRRQSFLVTEELIDTISLEDLCKAWPARPPSFAFKQALIEKVATISRLLHTHGLNHRDFYLCHFLLARSSIETKNAKNLSLYLIDLHRAQQRASTPQRWIIKDIGSLFYSTFNVGLNKRDYYRFIKHYTQMPLKQALANDRFWQQVMARAAELQKKLPL